MLNIYYGRESADKEKFIYEMIMERGFSAASPVLVLVPDQYTLEAERQAFRVTGRDALIGLDVYSISRLEHNVIADTGQGGASFIDKYGRQMLLTKILSELKDELSVYSGSVRKPAFIEMLNDYISQLKQYDVSPELYRKTAEGLPEGDALSLKMRDISKVYTAYDERIGGKYTDSEDYVELFLSRADGSGLLRRSAVWVYGFDSFAPKSLKVLGKLMALCPEVNVVLTYDEGAADGALFGLTGTVRDNLIAAARENGAGTGEVRQIREMYPDGRYDVKKTSAEIEHLEHELYSVMPAPMREAGAAEHEESGGRATEGVTIIESANYYNEAESAAAYILHLIRDRGYRYRDIAVICNDADKRGAALEHAFSEYGLPAFLDKKRSISGSVISVYISAMVTACIRGMRTADIMRALKTGLGVLSQEDAERLEDYAVCYRIDRDLWGRSFRYGAERYGEDGPAALEKSRALVYGTFGKLRAVLKGKQSYSDFLEKFCGFLYEDAGLPERLAGLVSTQESCGLRDAAGETQQIWSQIVNILGQIGAILGDEPFDAEEFLNIFTVGLRQSEIGIMPTSPDDLMIGTMQRTRVGRVKAILVVGANDGVIPMGSGTSGLFAEQEEERLAESGFEACKSRKVRLEEEKLAIYRCLSRPDSELWISWTASDDEGNTLRPSELIEDIQRLFPYKSTGRDILNTGRAEDLIGGRISTLRHLADAEVKAKQSAGRDPVWDGVLSWYSEHEPGTVKSMMDGLGFDDRVEPIGEELSDILFSGRGSDRLSPSGLEGYAVCPFAYFIGNGLRPEEWRIFETGPREIGDVCHDSLMKITTELTERGLWDTVTSEQLAEMVKKTVRSEREEYGGGLLAYSASDSYRADRMEKTIQEAAEVLIRHARAGKIAESMYEQDFARGAEIKPIEAEADGKKIYIEGRIDRLDILENGRVKIIDYKSGRKTLEDNEIRSGYRLQLMLYMKAAQEGAREPAGVFYFYLGTGDVDTGELKGRTIADEVDAEDAAEKRASVMQGIVIDDPETITEILGEEGGKSIASITKNARTGEYKGTRGSAVLPESEFGGLQKAVDEKINELVSGIREGRIEIRPMRSRGKRLACEYCEYSAVCRFDTGFRGCRYNDIDRAVK